MRISRSAIHRHPHVVNLNEHISPPAVAASDDQVPTERPECTGEDGADATSSREAVPDYAAGLQAAEHFGSHPLRGRRIGVLRDGSGDGGMHPAVTKAVTDAAAHLQSLGAEIQEVPDRDVASAQCGIRRHGCFAHEP